MRGMLAWLLVVALVAGLARSAPVAAQAVGLTVTAPTEGAVVTGSDVTVTFQVSGIRLVPTTVPLEEAGKRPDANRPGEGHVHFMLDLLPVVVWERDAPYRFVGIPAGPHRLLVEVVENDHSSLAPPVVQTIHFRTDGSATLPRGGEAPVPVPPLGQALALVFGATALAGGLGLRRRR